MNKEEQKEIIIGLEEYIDTKTLKGDINEDNMESLLTDKKILQDIDDCFKGQTNISDEYISYLTDNSILKDLIETLLFEKNKMNDSFDDIINRNKDDIIKNYFDSIKNIKIFTPEEEREIFARLRKIEKKLSEETNPDTYKKYEKIRDEIRNEIITRNLKLVVSIAKRKKKNNDQFMEYIQEGNLGLYKAIEKFDLNKKTKFSTYAHWWIRHSITRFIENQTKTIKIPSYVYQLIPKWKKINEAIQEERNTDKIDYMEIAQRELENEVDENKIINRAKLIKEVLNVYTNPVSLDYAYSEEDDNLQNIIPDKNAEDPQKQTETNIIIETIEEILQKVEPREKNRMMFEMRFGLNRYDVHTYRKIGEKFNITRQGAETRVKFTTNKVKKELNKERYKDIIEELLTKIDPPERIDSKPVKTKIKKAV